MMQLRVWLTRLIGTFGGRRCDRELASELDGHLQCHIDDNLRAGMTADEARRDALLKLGGVEIAKERWRDQRSLPWVEDLTRDLRHAFHRLRRSPVFTAAAVLSLALAIGANAAIFAIVHRVVLNPLPYPDSDRVIELDHGAKRLKLPSGLGMTQGLYYHYAERSRTLDGVALYRTDELTLTGDGEPERLHVAHSTPSLASVLRVEPVLGRWFTQAEGVPGAAPVAVLSHGLWVRRYHSDTGVLGRPVTIGGVPMEVVGIMPASYGFPDSRIDVWTAVQLTHAMGFGLWNYEGVARMRDRATVTAVRTELNALIADLPQAYPGDRLAVGNGSSIGLASTARTLKEAAIGNVERGLWILLASVGLMLLVACANVANLFLVRSEVRQHEVAVRMALGAGRLGIVRYFLSESILLSIAGGAVGLALAWGAVQLLVGFGPVNLPRLEEVHLDRVTIAFTCILSLLAAPVFGSIPLLRRAPLSGTLHESGRVNTASRRRHIARHVLMGAQIALALLLLIASGLMVRSFQRLRALDPGFTPSSALTFGVGLPETAYKDRRAAVAAHRAILDRLSALPGVTAASASTCLPLAGACGGNTVRVAGRIYPPGTVPPLALFHAVAGSYFETMGIRLVRGRGIDWKSIDRAESVVVVDEVFADRFFPGLDPIGEHIASNRPPARVGETPQLEWLTIIGVVSQTPARALAETQPIPQIYMPMSIAGGPDIPSSDLVGPNVAVMSYVVRSATAPSGLLPSVRRAIDSIDPNLALAQVGTLQDTLDRASAQMAFTTVLLAIAASVALMLGVIGIYGVMSYIVSQRTGEIGVRLALGAEPGTVAGMIVRQGGLVALVGIAVGLAAALSASRLIESLLYGVGPRDPAVFTATTLTLFAVALLACWLPARRAASVDPLIALRAQ